MTTDSQMVSARLQRAFEGVEGVETLEIEVIDVPVFKHCFYPRRHAGVVVFGVTTHEPLNQITHVVVVGENEIAWEIASKHLPQSLRGCIAFIPTRDEEVAKALAARLGSR